MRKKIREELVAASRDDDYLCDLDEEFCDLSSEGEDPLRKRSSDVSTNEPARKKARTDPGPPHAISDRDSEEEIPVVRGRRTTRIADDDNDDDNAVAADVPSESESVVSGDGIAPLTQVGHGYRNVTNPDSVPF
jgi:hypothetical protein